ncbi:transporter [Rhizobium mayense]|uniref:Transporter n=1 Tax=Rhizobium mayense TaxID=1312184 RepID=A0ABT7JM69_9HYPH|nr:transporter [Rhizobium mayense]MDL2397440.1 transporter [Rhizobium mayense]
MRRWLIGGALAICWTASAQCQEQHDDSDLAKKLSNPVADLISIPFQFNYNDGIGPAKDGSQVYLNVQPVVPFHLNDDWNLISRTILPIIHQHEIFPGSGTQFGLGDITQSFFFSPAKPVNGFVWGVGPAFGIPTATDDLLGSGKWSAGPTGVALWQGEGWTVGALANHLWSFAGERDRPNVNATFLQPFVAYTTKSAWTFSLNTESTYNWEAHEWSVPINLQVAKIVKFGKLPVQLFAAARYWADSPDGGPTGWGARVGMTFLLPTEGL